MDCKTIPVIEGDVRGNELFVFFGDSNLGALTNSIYFHPNGSYEDGESLYVYGDEKSAKNKDKANASWMITVSADTQGGGGGDIDAKSAADSPNGVNAKSHVLTIGTYSGDQRVLPLKKGESFEIPYKVSHKDLTFQITRLKD